IHNSAALGRRSSHAKQNLEFQTNRNFTVTDHTLGAMNPKIVRWTLTGLGNVACEVFVTLWRPKKPIKFEKTKR
ncbi:MAG: hypothetical protein L7U64_08650, partial [Luminiphilus sp.]|nr:hypothetical protein [Luminiphilus sp.]